MTDRLARLTTGRRSRWVVVGVWAVLMLGFAPLTAKLNSVKVDTTTSLLPPGSESGHVEKLLSRDFANGDKQDVILIYHRAGGLTAADRERIVADARAAADIPLTGSATPAFAPGPGGSLQPVPRLVSSDGATAFTIVPMSAGRSEQVANSIKLLRALGGGATGGLEYHVTGSAVLLNDINNAVQSADIVLLAATVLLVLALLLFIYRSPILALVPLLVVIVSYVIASGVVYLLARAGLQVDSTATSLLLILMFGAGTDYCLLLVARYKEDLHRFEDEQRALRYAIPRALPAIAASGLTVAAALLTLLASELDTNRTLGPVTAVGILIVLSASMTLLPAILSLLGRRGFWPSRAQAAYDPVRRGQSLTIEQVRETRWAVVARRVMGRPWLAAGGGAALLVAGAFGLLAFHSDPTPIKEFRTSTDSKAGYELFRRSFPVGEVAPSTVVIERSGGRAVASASDVALVESRLSSLHHAVADVFPATPERSRDGRIARLTLVLASDPLRPQAEAVVDEVRAAVAHVSPGLTVLVGDGAARFRDQGVAEHRDLLVIAPLVLFVIFCVLIVLLRALVAPLFLLATVVLSYLGSMGASTLVFRYVFGRHTIDPLLPILAFIFLVALGVDYNIFLMSRIREEAVKRGTRDGVLRGLVSTGPVITSAGVILAGTFLVLTTLPVWLLFELGFTVAFGVLVDTFLVRSAIVPAVTTLLGDKIWWPSSPRAGTRGLSGVIEAPVTAAPERVEAQASA
ncbi:MAG TPA: MMPL family transporter [Solirubrobacteraceae bacterium]|nr:MMPL family transporter [Solirubrobacteraceae bacterium]